MDTALAPQHSPPPLAQTTPWRHVVDAYLAAATDSPHTRRAYARHLRNACTALAVPTLADLNGAQLAAYRAAVTSRLAPASQSQALAALRSFLTWSRALGAHHLPAEVIATALRTPRASVRRPYQVLSDGETADMLASAVTDRDRALLAVLLGAGLRVAEVVALDVSDVLHDHEGQHALYVRQGKGRKDRAVPMQSDVAQLLRAYLAGSDRRLGDAGPLFPRVSRGHPSGRLSTRAVGSLVVACAQRAGISAKRISPHSLRHTYALRALRHSGNVVAVSKLLGHASMTTTQRYVDHLGMSELRAAVPELPRRA